MSRTRRARPRHKLFRDFQLARSLLSKPRKHQVESTHPSQEEVDSASPQGADGESKAAAGDGGGGMAASRPSVLPAPILEPVMPARTRLQEAGAEVAVYYSQIEGQVIVFCLV